MHIDQLSNVCPGNSCVILSIDLQQHTKNRLYELGFIPGTVVKIAVHSPSRETIALWVKGALIALRRCTCSHIVVDLLV